MDAANLIYIAAKAIVAHVENEKPAVKPATPVLSNGIPICVVHGKAMKLGSEKQKAAGYLGPRGYKCTVKDPDGSWCKEIA